MAFLKAKGPWKHPKTGVYWCRIVIPEHLRAFAKGGPGEPKHEYRRSLHTKDKRAANRAMLDAVPVYLVYERELETRKAKSAGDGSKLPGFAHALDAESAMASDPRALAVSLAGVWLEEHLSNPLPRIAFANRRSVPPGPWGKPSEPWTYNRYRIALDSRAPVSRASTLEFLTEPAKAMLDRLGLTLSADDWEQFCEFARDEFDRAFEVIQRSHRGEPVSPPTRALATQALEPARHPKVRITGLVDVWAKGRERVRPETRDKYTAKLRHFSAFVGHDDASAAVLDDLYRWRDQLREEGRDAKYVEVDTIAVVRTVYRAAVGARVLGATPFADYVPIKRDQTKQKARHPYSDEQTKRVLKAARKEKGALRWLPWVLAYTGARVREIADLRTDDVGESRGVPFLRITDEGEGKSVKTRASVRDVPLHAALIKEGFVKFVKAAGKGPLFADLPLSKRYGTRGLAASDRYMDWLRNVVRIADPKIVAYSWRHRMEDELREIDAPDEVAFAITGRTRQGSRAGYGHGVSLRKKAEWIAKVPAVKV